METIGVEALCRELATQLVHESGCDDNDSFLLVGIPRGGVVVAYALAYALQGLGRVSEVTTPLEHEEREEVEGAGGDVCVVLCDDIVVTGASIREALTSFDVNEIVVLVRKGEAPLEYGTLESVTLRYGTSRPSDHWQEFPWEAKEQDGKPLDAVTRLIEYVGDDPTRPGLRDTPARVLRFLDEIREQGKQEVDAVLFDSGEYEDLLVVRNIPLTSLCEHHIMLMTGEVSIGYIPNGGKVLGLSKLARIAGVASARLTLQETLTRDIAKRIAEAAASEDVAVITRISHSCMVSRGVRSLGSDVVVSSMHGVFRESSALRQEFLELIN